MNKEIKELNKKAEKYSKVIEKAKEEISKTIVGQDEVVEKILLGLMANGHILIEGVPGLAKTMIIKTLSGALDSDFTRLQFTPDLLPADIIGTKIYKHEESKFETIKGPIFSNFILADEINRAPPKVQSALLEAMQERQVTIQGETYKISPPFMVLATQNPIESEGTYKLPEAQVDRFAFKIIIEYPTKEQESEIMHRFTENIKISTSKIISEKQILEIQKFNREIYADEKIRNYVAKIIDATRNPEKYNLDFKEHIEFGASPRASLWLILAAKASAMLNARGYVKPEDIKKVAHEVLRHRLILTYEAEADEITPDEIITKLLNKIRAP
jgi:MoxR-like ATPase